MKTVNYIDLGVHYGQEIDLLLSQYSAFSNNVKLNIYGIEANTIIANALIDKYEYYSDIVNIYNFAISDSDFDKTKLYISTGSDLGSSIYASKKNVSSSFLEVDSIRISTFINKYIPNFNNSINILKLNIEGAELLVYHDLIHYNMLNKFALLCGHPSHDIEKIPELYSKRSEYYKLLQDNNIQLEYFCAEASLHTCINIFNRLGL
jgi:FkbM family methyltransferase